MNTAAITTMLDELSVNSEPEAFQRVDDMLKVMGDFLADAKLRRDAAKLEWIEDHACDLVINGVRYYAGQRKTEKCRDAKRLCDTLIREHSLDDLGDCLASDAFKPGACRRVLGPAWDVHFEVTLKPVIVEGKPKKELLSINERFVGRGA